ncbi:hypothetical protein H9X85_05655 [Anaerotignum lactatifermentans]|uniref:Uncharacterized protein n=1 Tax=Anaerotignum lactatifermentans TaxID=160404 RepID=A0ABS2G839_9FIRM|nr:Ger(x)C family spore germination C-terminal domain-containing protein [Anaerotignum lactatifermentans]MBM6829066.1 hypothetical protein [Anaerotignum lactatifermentans]MBM6877327.1 hypothetical protein [Anaerotignum lactatifermentans]MBM6950698.1 hypothetical protein [Anaerotignum lactatifermentans]
MAKIRLCFLILCLCLLSGCWDGRDPEDRAYVITLGIEKGEDGLLFTFAPGTSSQKGEVFSVEARTLTEAAAKAAWTRSREVYLGQLRNIIFGKSLLSDLAAFSSVLDELERGSSISEKVMILGTSGSAAQCVTAIGEQDQATGLFLWDFYKNTAETVAVTRGLDLDIWLTELREQEGSGVLPRIEAEDGTLTLGGSLVVAEGAYAFALTPEQEQDRLLLMGEGKGAVFQQTYEGAVLPFTVRQNRADYEFWQEDGEVVCRVCLRLSGSLGGSGGNAVLSAETLEQLENLFQESIKSHLENTIKVVQSQTTGDVLGLAAEYARHLPETPDFDWTRMEILVEPEISIVDTGRTR